MTNHEFTRDLIIVSMVIVLSVVLFVELRILRARRRRRRDEGELPDRAHNAILTSKAIRDTLARGGVRSTEADDLIREADGALRMRHYRVAVEVAERARGVLRSAKQRSAASGDLAKLETLAGKDATAEVTAKERLAKELPPNYMQSKFTMNLAREEIDGARGQGRDILEAERHVAAAQAAFDAQDFDGALRHAVRARRSLEAPEPATSAGPPETPATPAPSDAGERTCPSCGVRVDPSDAFCRACGFRIPEQRACGSCGARVAAEDAFCRACGASVPVRKP